MPLKENEVLRFARFNVVESSNATFTEISLDTNLSIRTPFVWQVRALQLEILAAANEWPADGATETIIVQFTRESKSAILNYNDPDLLEKVTRELRRVDISAVGNVHQVVQNPITVNYNSPIIYANSNLYIGILSTFGSGVANVRGRIGFTIEKVSEKAFFRFASAL